MARTVLLTREIIKMFDGLIVGRLCAAEEPVHAKRCSVVVPDDTAGGMSKQADDCVLLTDFGTRDHYAGVLKGVVLSICPDATVVDLSHDLPAHDIPFAARELAATYKYFPSGTIFLVVVDPGVGSARRGLAAESGRMAICGARQWCADRSLS